MIDALLIVFKETLEASLIISFLLIFSKEFKISFRWLNVALILGLFLAFLFARQMPYISELGNGVGQEILQCGVLICIAVALIFIQSLATIQINKPENERDFYFFNYYFGLAVATAISLEGAEIMIYLNSQYLIGQNTAPAFTGGLLGLGIGISAAIIFYYLLSQIIPKYSFTISRLLIILIASAMLSQSLTFLMQAGLIENNLPFWDSNGLVNETSFAGQILYSIIGYEATPALSQVLVYFSAIGISLIAPKLIQLINDKQAINNSL